MKCFHSLILIVSDFEADEGLEWFVVFSDRQLGTGSTMA